MTDFGGLPDHIQIMVAGSVMIIGSAWGVIKFIKPFIDHLTPKPKATESTDAVVISAALADGKSIRDLTHAIEQLCYHQQASNRLAEQAHIVNTMLYEVMVRLSMKD